MSSTKIIDVTSSLLFWTVTAGSCCFAGRCVIMFSFDCTHLLLINVYCHLAPSGMIQTLTVRFWGRRFGCRRGC